MSVQFRSWVLLALSIFSVSAIAQDNAPAAASSDLNLDELISNDAAPAAQEQPTPAASESPTAAPEEKSADHPTAEILDTIPVGKKETAEVPKGPSNRAAAIEEIVVTSNKRAENVRTLAGSVTAIGKDRMEEIGASSFGDYLAQAPGVSFNASVPGQSVVAIRGISTDTIPGTSQGAVGVYYDDIPLSDPAAPLVIPDIDAFDAERVEVLKGPQGALFGSASMGGAINYIPTAPKFDGWQFSAQATGSRSTNSTLGGSGKLMFNAPLYGDKLALRGVGYYNYMPGYIDNVGTGQDRSNRARTGGGRVMLGWAPTEDSALRLTALYQKTSVDDTGYVNPSLGDLKKDTIQSEPNFNQTRLASLRYELQTDYGSWAFIGGYQEKASELNYDGASALGIGALGLTAPLVQSGNVKGYSTELRFVSTENETFNWLAGISYADRTEKLRAGLDLGLLSDLTAALQSLGLQLPANSPLSTSLVDIRGTIKAPEAAAFIDANYQITSSLKLSAGGRLYNNVVDSHVDNKGVLIIASGQPEVVIDQKDKATGFNPKVSLSYEFSPDLMAYMLYSKGYRLGGPNLVPNTVLTPTKSSYGPDTVSNYEIGSKSDWLDGTLTLDLSLFYIDWKDIPLQIPDSTGVFKYNANVGNARSKGVETTVAYRPVDFLTARSSVTWLHAELLNDYDPKNGRPPAKAGDQLPGSPTWSVSNSVTAIWPWQDHNPTLTLMHHYEGPSSSNLSYKDIKKGNYNLFDARAGMKFGAFGVNAFVKNITDERGTTAVNNQALKTGGILSLQFIVPPRTFGLELNYSFED